MDFVHPKFGFSARYPAGYAVVSSNDEMGAARFFAFGTGEMPTSIYFLVTNESVSKNDANSFVSDLSLDESIPSKILWNGTVNYGSNSYYFVNASTYSADAEEDLFFYYAFRSCPKYTAIIEGIVPTGMVSERPVVYAVLESFKC